MEEHIPLAKTAAAPKSPWIAMWDAGPVWSPSPFLKEAVKPYLSVSFEKLD
jgi:hypothetical protein